MKQWIGLLRAVNVGGTAKLPMAEFREALEAAALAEVQTYIASGNVVFKSALEAPALAALMNDVLNQQFNISGNRSLVLEAAVLERIIRQNPFREAATSRPEKLHVHFLMGEALPDADLRLTSYKGAERLRLMQQHLYIDYPNGSGQSALTPRFLETALGCQGTARNWNTVLKLQDMLQS